MLKDLLLSIGSSAIYDVGKTIKDEAAKHETVQTVLKQLGASSGLHDFPDRYVEALVEFRFLGKDAVVMAFFREESIAQVFFNFYYGEDGQRNDEEMLRREIARGVEALKVGDAVKAKQVNVTAELEQFWQVFKQKVQENRTVKEVEMQQLLEDLQRKTNNTNEMLRDFQRIMRENSKEYVQIGKKIYDMDSIHEGNFGTIAKEVKNALINSPVTVGGDFHVGDKTENHYHIYRDKNIPRLLTTSPFNANLFIGREKDLTAIEAQYQAHKRLLVLVNGEGGIGKTTLAAKYWYAYEARYKHLAWLYADAGIGAALVTLKAQLGVHFEQTDDMDTQVRRMVEAISNLDGPCLLVFDNANDAADLKKYYTTLHQLPNCHILLTSRANQVANISVHKVQPLPEKEAIQLFRHYYPELPDADVPMLHDVLKAVGYNTLVTEVLAKNLAVINKRGVKYPLGKLLWDLQAKGLLALTNKAVEVVYGRDQLREAEPAEIIAAMYDLAALSDAERYVLSNLAVLPAKNIPYDLIAKSIIPTPLKKTLWDKIKTLFNNKKNTVISEEMIQSSIEILEEKGWFEYIKADNSFKISPVIQEVTRKKNADRLLTDCRALVNALTTGLNEEKRHTDNYQQAAVFAHLGTAVMHVLPVDYDVATLLCAKT